MRKVDLHDMTDNDGKRSLCLTSIYTGVSTAQCCKRPHDSTSTGTRM